MKTSNSYIILMFAQSVSKQVYFHNPISKLYVSCLSSELDTDTNRPSVMHAVIVSL